MFDEQFITCHVVDSEGEQKVFAQRDLLDCKERPSSFNSGAV
jgi:hypothetical protein